MVATLSRMAVTNRAKATSAVCPPGPAARPASTSSSAPAPSTARIASPETGLLDEPISPAMYPHTDATTKPATTI